MTDTGDARLTRALDHDFSAAITLGVGVVVAVLWSATSHSYFRVLYSATTWRPMSFLDVSSVHDLTVNALMAIFFYAIGLELARELRSGFLVQARDAVAPILGAVGGMLVTALASITVGALVHSAALRRGWGVPMATDVAFSLGVLAIAGRRLDPAVRVFLLTLAVTDDVLSVIVLSVTGSAHPRVAGFVMMGAVTLLGVVASRRVTRASLNVALLVALWIGFAWAHVEPALSGALAGALVSADPAASDRLERGANRLSVGLVLPLFALVACGVQWPRLHLGDAVTTIVIATIFIRLIGKTLGVTLGVGAARVLGFRIHHSMNWSLVAAVGLTCAIGFTVPLLFAASIFGGRSPLYAGYTLGLLTSSVIAALAGGMLLHARRRAE